MSYESTIHEAQGAILHSLLFTPSAGFAELQKSTDLTSDHFTFHLKKLVENGYVEKLDERYALTVAGKEFANRFDTDINAVEKQPKLSVLLIVEREHNGNKQYLMQQRLKQPFYGYWGRFGGKVAWGESFEQTAKRELQEESGLDGDFTYKFTYRKRDYKQSDNTLLEDKVFIIMHCNNASGELLHDFEGGHNEWVTPEELQNKAKVFEGAILLGELAEQGVPYYAKDYLHPDSDY